MKLQCVPVYEVFCEKGNDIAFMQLGTIGWKTNETDWYRVAILVPETKRCYISLGSNRVDSLAGKLTAFAGKTIEDQLAIIQIPFATGMVIQVSRVGKKKRSWFLEVFDKLKCFVIVQHKLCTGWTFQLVCTDDVTFSYFAGTDNKCEYYGGGEPFHSCVRR